MGFPSPEAVTAPTNGVQRTHLNRFRRGRRREGEKERRREGEKERRREGEKERREGKANYIVTTDSSI